MSYSGQVQRREPHGFGRSAMGRAVGEGLKSYYRAKIEELEILSRDRQHNLRRLEAQRNELNTKGAPLPQLTANPCASHACSQRPASSLPCLLAPATRALNVLHRHFLASYNMVILVNCVRFTFGSRTLP